MQLPSEIQLFNFGYCIKWVTGLWMAIASPRSFTKNAHSASTMTLHILCSPPLSRYLGCKLCVSCSVRSNPSVSGFIAQFAPGESSGICSPSPLVASTVDKQGTIIGRHMKARSFERRTCVQPPWLPRTMDSVLRYSCSLVRPIVRFECGVCHRHVTTIQ